MRTIGEVVCQSANKIKKLLPVKQNSLGRISHLKRGKISFAKRSLIDGILNKNFVYFSFFNIRITWKYQGFYPTK